MSTARKLFSGNLRFVWLAVLFVSSVWVIGGALAVEQVVGEPRRLATLELLKRVAAERGLPNSRVKIDAVWSGRDIVTEAVFEVEDQRRLWQVSARQGPDYRIKKLEYTGWTGAPLPEALRSDQLRGLSILWAASELESFLENPQKQPFRLSQNERLPGDVAGRVPENLVYRQRRGRGRRNVVRIAVDLRSNETLLVPRG